MSGPRVTGVGGVFIKAKDPAALSAWYKEMLGIPVQSWGGAAFDSKDEGEVTTAWSLFATTSKKFDPSTAPFMVNYRVNDLHGLLAKLKAAKCQVMEKVDESEYGKFGWVVDPEGNKIELWQPPA